MKSCEVVHFSGVLNSVFTESYKYRIYTKNNPFFEDFFGMYSNLRSKVFEGRVIFARQKGILKRNSFPLSNVYALPKVTMDKNVPDI